MQELKILIDLLIEKIKLNTDEEQVKFSSTLMLAAFTRLLKNLSKTDIEIKKMSEELSKLEGKESSEDFSNKIEEISVEINSLPNQDKVAEMRAEVFVAVIDETAQNFVKNEIMTQEDYDDLEKEFAEAVKKADMEKPSE